MTHRLLSQQPVVGAESVDRARRVTVTSKHQSQASSQSSSLGHLHRRVCTSLVVSYLQDAVHAINHDGAQTCSKLLIDFIFMRPEGIFSGISHSRLGIG